MMVVDASAIVELLSRSPAGAVLRHWILADDNLHAPHLIDLEVANTLRRLRTPEPFGKAALAEMGLLPLQRHGHLPFLPRIWELRHNITAYDACYVALAEFLDCEFITTDRRLANSCGGRVKVRVLEAQVN